MHHLAPFSSVGGLAFDGRTHGDDMAVLGARDRARDQQQLTGFVDADDVEVLGRARCRRPGGRSCFLPGNTRPGSCAIEIEPGTLCERLLPCDARCELKLWRLMVPAKPLPIDVPCTSTFWPTANTRHGHWRHRPCTGRRLSAVDAEFLDDFAGFDTRLGEVAGFRLGDARCLARTERHLQGAVAVGLCGLDLGHAVVGHIEHRHGNWRRHHP